MNSDEFWKNKIRAFLHDPPDKAFELKTHEKRIKEILGDLIPSKSIKRKIKTADTQASSLQRIDLEKSKDGKELRSTFDRVHDTEKYEYIGYPVIRHPVTGEVKEFCIIAGSLPEVDKPVINVRDSERDDYEKRFYSLLDRILKIEKETFSKLVKSGGSKEDYLRIWTFYEDELKNALKSEFSESFAEEFVNLPAYTLSPDHTLFDHADATSVIYGAECNGRKPVLLLFKLNPVQKFIADSRKEKDLWAASHILAALTFSAICAIVEKFGPDAVIYPHLRNNPFFRAWIFSKGIHDSKPEPKTLSAATVPNKFFAIVGIENEGELDELENEVSENVNGMLEELFGSVWSEVWDGVVAKNGFLDSLVEKISKKLEEEIEKCSDEKRKISLENELREVLEYRSNKKKLHKEILLSHFNSTLSFLKVPEIDLSGDKKNAYAKLKDFVESLNLPKNIERKYLEWLEMLEKVEASDNKPSKYDLYSLYYEILLELNAIESAKFVKPAEPSGFKCTLCGEHLAIGGESEQFMKELWEKIHRELPGYLRENERLCAVCLVKRFYPKFLRELELFEKIDSIVPKTESVSEVAMCKSTKAGIAWKDIYDYLRDEKNLDEILSDVATEKYENLKAKLKELKSLIKKLIVNVEEQLKKQRYYSDDFLRNLHKSFSNEILYIENLRDAKSLLDTLGFRTLDSVNIDESLLSEVRDKLSEISRLIEEEPPKYYAILVMDGDEIGKLLSGDKLLATASYLHPEVLKKVGDDLKVKAENVKRLVTPAAHAAISKAVMNFAVNHVFKIVESNGGTLIYAGGDDVLALLPVDTALNAAIELADAFSKSWNGWKILPGGTISAGILIVHYKHPLYDALDKARSLLEKAKNLGRNAIAIGLLKRSGSYYEAVANYETVSYVKAIAELIAENRVSPRVLYDLMSVVNKLPGEGELMQIVKYEATRHAKENDDARFFVSLFSNGVSCVRVEFEEVYEISNRVEFQKFVNELVREGRVRELKKSSGFCGCDAAYDFVVKKQAMGFLSLVKIVFDAERGDER